MSASDGLAAREGATVSKLVTPPSPPTVASGRAWSRPAMIPSLLTMLWR